MEIRLSPHVEGPQDGETLFFVQGWPDDLSIWDSLVGSLRDRYRCVRVNLPNYGDGPTARWGADTDAIVDALAACVREVSPAAPVTLILHDWGAIWGTIMHHRHPTLAYRLVILDVAPHMEPGPLAALGIAAYQSFLTIAFLIGGRLGAGMTQQLAKLLGAPQTERRLRSEINYPYRNALMDLATGRFRRNLAGYRPGAPLLFVYGTKKPFQFHSSQWLTHVNTVGGEVLPLDFGHWVQRHPDFNTQVQDFLSRTDTCRDSGQQATPEASTSP